MQRAAMPWREAVRRRSCVRPGEVRVVEDDLARPDASASSSAGELGERAAALVPVESEVPACDVFGSDAGLPGPGHAHDEQDVAFDFAPRARERAAGAMRSRSSRSRSSRAARADERAASGVRAPGNGDEVRRRARGATRARPRPPSRRACRDARQLLVSREPARAARSAERRVRDHGEPELGAALDDAATDRPVVERADPDLNGRDRREVQGLVQLRTVDVADADSRDEPSSTSRASARTDVAHGVRGSGVCRR